ncbi:MAG: uncharacterized membrane protein YidH (DUF202 family) [Candidatus Paceibacteria bacterium]|jgi:uncharacterized membrane protein YidH (DUF202 family)
MLSDLHKFHMKKISHVITSVSLLALPLSASAAFEATGGRLGTLLGEILTFANNVLIPFIIGIGFLVFVWGMFRFFIAGGANEEAKEQGKSLMIYATLGFVLIIVFWGIINLLTSSTGLENGNVDFETPTVTVP